MPTDDSALARPNPPGSASPTPTDLGRTDPASTDPASRPSLRSMLTDKFGQLALRSLQIIVVLILATVVVFALVQLKLVVIPLLIAIILAAAVSPVLRWLKHHGFSA